MIFTLGQEFCISTELLIALVKAKGYKHFAKKIMA